MRKKKSTNTKIQQSLTKKRRLAIYACVSHKQNVDPYLSLRDIVDASITAERAKAEDLYKWLHTRGYRWKNQQWKQI